jgi:23S rRNA pseudouridine2457 synthase
MNYRYFVANKPFNTICQFSQEVEGQMTLADLNTTLPKDVYPIGRLDQDSEGLLLLTSDRSLNHRLLNPQFAHRRTYLAQIEGVPTEEALAQFRKGVTIKIEKKLYDTLPAECQPVEDPSVYFDNLPIWTRLPMPKSSGNKPMSWLEVTLTEGKNRQVRRMCAAIGHPCLRLIRVSMMDLKLGILQPNEVREMDAATMLSLLNMH